MLRSPVIGIVVERIWPGAGILVEAVNRIGPVYIDIAYVDIGIVAGAGRGKLACQTMREERALCKSIYLGAK